MNRYPLWKYIIVALALVFGLIYTLPNFFGESPAVQVSSVKATLKVDTKTLERVESTLKTASVESFGIFLDANGVKVRLKDTDTQLKTRDLLEKQFNPDASDPQYVVALNLLSSSPQWLTSLGALPMYLGLDLRGGVHFLLQVDMQGALTKRLDSISADLRSLMRDKTIRHGGVNREGDRIVIRFRDEETRTKGRQTLEDNQPDLQFADQGEGADLKLTASLSSYRGYRTRPRPRTFWAAPRRWKSAWSTTPPVHWKRLWPGKCPSGPNSTSNAVAGLCWSRNKSY